MKLIKKGNYANADLYLSDNRIYKTFRNKSFLIRNTIGRLFCQREFMLYQKLQNIPGYQKNTRKYAYSISFEYIKGSTLSEFISQNKKLPSEKLIQLETDIKKLHRLGYVHLDLRNAKNIIVDENNNLYMIDFQSAIKLYSFLPHFLRNFLMAMDVTAISKFWPKICFDEISIERKTYFEHYNRYRKLWFLKGYPLKKMINKLKGSFYTQASETNK